MSKHRSQTRPTLLAVALMCGHFLPPLPHFLLLPVSCGQIPIQKPSQALLDRQVAKQACPPLPSSSSSFVARCTDRSGGETCHSFVAILSDTPPLSLHSLAFRPWVGLGKLLSRSIFPISVLMIGRRTRVYWEVSACSALSTQLPGSKLGNPATRIRTEIELRSRAVLHASS